jgi:hypothetical protein
LFFMDGTKYPILYFYQLFDTFFEKIHTEIQKIVQH